MPIEIPSDLTPELVPFAWLLGEWEGDGFLGYGDVDQRPFRQHVHFAHHGLPFLEYRAETHLIDEDGLPARLIAVENGFWQLERSFEDGDLGPGLLPPDVVPVLRDADSVEKLRTADGGFPVLATINRPGGVSELYLGEINGPRIQLGTDAVMRSPGAKQYTAATRMFGLVNGDLFWAWDMAAEGHPLGTHASAELKKKD
ncbi:FABP family protein [Kocuria sp. JC486]|uniref:Peroxynitrite isomerase n=1 Tax=Kocuria soli TaxID=2485125 RepID=A0A3N4AC44_9MICC|nr:FABP family protein [Kocuria soli]NHU84724.1 FABP family protein [Kocuria sp. JC486]ROZ63463.1 FABP family protein [Kocuria soli]